MPTAATKRIDTGSLSDDVVALLRGSSDTTQRLADRLGLSYATAYTVRIGLVRPDHPSKPAAYVVGAGWMPDPKFRWSERLRRWVRSAAPLAAVPVAPPPVEKKPAGKAQDVLEVIAAVGRQLTALHSVEFDHADDALLLRMGAGAVSQMAEHLEKLEERLYRLADAADGKAAEVAS